MPKTLFVKKGIFLNFLLITYSSLGFAFEYSISNGKEAHIDELQSIQQCCGNPEVYSPGFRTSIPCANATPEAQRCLREKTQQISSGAFEQRGEQLLKELPPVGRQFLIDQCGITNLVFSSIEQTIVLGEF